MRSLTSTELRFCDDTFSSHALHDPDVLSHWFVVTPSGHSVFVQNEVKAQRLRRLYDDMGLGWCSLMIEEMDCEEEAPF